MLRALDDKGLLDRYIEIKQQLSELEEELESLKGPLLDALMEEPDSRAEYHGFQFKIQYRKTYSYSEKVKELEDILKKAREHEKSSGIAEVVKDKAVLVMTTQK